MIFATVVQVRSINIAMEKENKISKETLYHFSCKECHKWWSIGDAPEDKKDWFCPWCGKSNRYTN